MMDRAKWYHKLVTDLDAEPWALGVFYVVGMTCRIFCTSGLEKLKQLNIRLWSYVDFAECLLIAKSGHTNTDVARSI